MAPSYFGLFQHLKVVYANADVATRAFQRCTAGGSCTVPKLLAVPGSSLLADVQPALHVQRILITGPTPRFTLSQIAQA